ncbi:MAG: hypothetical protein FH753_06785 [Firmicutes bacterium]|nr:hypothetical protein [Bacillota bacterium]
MKLNNVYTKNGTKLADFGELNKGWGIEFDDDTGRVKELHFSIVLQVDDILETRNLSRDEQNLYFYNLNDDILTVPLKSDME